jgi:hypothetical protein
MCGSSTFLHRKEGAHLRRRGAVGAAALARLAPFSIAGPEDGFQHFKDVVNESTVLIIGPGLSGVRIRCMEMTADTVADTLFGIVNVKLQVAVIALVLTAFGALFIKNATDSTGFAALFVPAIMLGCLIGVYTFKMLGIVVSTTKDTNIIATAGIGMVLAFIVMVGLVRAAVMIGDATRPINLDGRTQETE